jgi:septal ring factor EnvC (AmiA/AmiB activator)
MIRFGVVAAVLLAAAGAVAQDIPGIENCTAEKALERRIGCMQSNINYLQQLIGKRAAEFQQKLDTANGEIAALKAAVVKLQAGLDRLQATVVQLQAAAKPAEVKPADAKSNDTKPGEQKPK